MIWALDATQTHTSSIILYVFAGCTLRKFGCELRKTLRARGEIIQFQLQGVEVLEGEWFEMIEVEAMLS